VEVAAFWEVKTMVSERWKLLTAYFASFLAILLAVCILAPICERRTRRQRRKFFNDSSESWWGRNIFGRRVESIDVGPSAVGPPADWTEVALGPRMFPRGPVDDTQEDKSVSSIEV